MLRLQYLRDVNLPNCDPRILKGTTGKIGKRSPVPLDYRRHQFSHDQLAIGPESLQCGRRGVSHSQSSDEDLGTAAAGNSCTGKFSQGILRAVHAAVHEFGAAQP